MFLTLMVIGIAGLFMMALPALGGHGHVHPGPMHGHAHGSAGMHGLPRGRGLGPKSAEIIPADTGARTPSLLRFVPSPRSICSMLALYGAFGNALVHAAHVAFTAAAFAAAVPALLVEYFAVRPLWNLIFRFQGQASSPLQQLVFSDARAVVPFRNGRGIVSTVRDGRLVQLSARLLEDQASVPVAVGDRLRIEDVDAERERVTVSIVPD